MREAENSFSSTCACGFAVVVTVLAIYICLAFLALYQRTNLIGRRGGGAKLMFLRRDLALIWM